MRKRALRRKVEERADRVPRLLARRQLQHLPDDYEHSDDRRGLEIDRRSAAMACKACGKSPGATVATTL